MIHYDMYMDVVYTSVVNPPCSRCLSRCQRWTVKVLGGPRWRKVEKPFFYRQIFRIPDKTRRFPWHQEVFGPHELRNTKNVASLCSTMFRISGLSAITLYQCIMKVFYFHCESCLGMMVSISSPLIRRTLFGIDSAVTDPKLGNMDLV